jgi:transcriptional regulator with XRE-family HTH domain
MSRVQNDVSGRQGITTRRNEIDGPPAAEEKPLPNGGGGAGRRPGRQPPWEKPEAESGSFGDWLRRQREMREISLREIADRTKISLRYLEAMEADRFDILPAPIFAKGFLREYARYVGLSPDEVVNHYLSVQAPEDGDENEVKKEEIRGVRDGDKPARGWTWGLLLLLAGALLLALVALFNYLAQRREGSAEQPPPSIAAPVESGVKSPPAPPGPAAPSAPLEVALDFTDTCWVEAVIDGKNRLSELRVQGESLQLDAQEKVVLKLGNAGAVEVQVNGFPLDLGKKKGEVVRDLQIDLDTVRALRERREAH